MADPIRLCSVDGCESPRKAHTYCGRHLQRFTKYGTTELPITIIEFPNEQWRPIPGYEGRYDVSDHGRVKSLARTVYDKSGHPRPYPERLLRPGPRPDGHLGVVLHVNGKRDSQLVHRLVLLAFVGLRPDGTEACHNNGVGTDNRLVNLRWDTHPGNSRDMVRHGTHNKASRTHCPQGHPYAGDNLYVKPSGGRVCRQCKRDRRQAQRDAKKRVT